MRRLVRRDLLLAAALLIAAPALAHDTWLLPGRFRIAPGEKLSLELTSGMAFPQVETAIKPDRIARAVARLGGQTTEIAERRGAEKALRLEVALGETGLAALAVELAPKSIDLEPAQVAEYLAEIGSPPAVVEAWNQMPAPKRWRELYTKHTKTFVRVGEGPTDGSFAEPLGMALELVPQSDPAGLVAGGELAILVLRAGQPFAGFVVELVGEGGQHERRTTDAAGRAVFRPERPGRLLLRGTEVRRSSRPDADWESDFTTLTLAVR